jgi:hypothetical protein
MQKQATPASKVMMEAMLIRPINRYEGFYRIAMRICTYPMHPKSVRDPVSRLERKVRIIIKTSQENQEPTKLARSETGLYRSALSLAESHTQSGIGSNRQERDHVSKHDEEGPQTNENQSQVFQQTDSQEFEFGVQDTHPGW